MFINFTKIKNITTHVAIMALLLLAAFIAPHDASAKGPLKQIPTLGYDAQGKYPAYDLEGDLEDFGYNSGNTRYTPEQLIGRMGYIDPKDVNKGKYKCVWICKDGFENVVGLNPAIKPKK